MPPVATPPVPEIRSPTLAIAEAGSRLQLAQMDYQAALEYRNRFLIEIHKKFALATACIVLALVGAPIALRFPRGGVGLVLGVSFTIFAIYYVCLIGGETLANRALLTPWVSMWLANGVFLLVGLLLYARMGHEAATTRGGDAGQMLAKIQSRLMRMGLLSPTHLDERA